MKIDDERPLSPWWRRTMFLVLALGFTILLGLSVMTYRKAPPIPWKVVDDTGKELFTGVLIYTRCKKESYTQQIEEGSQYFAHGAPDLAVGFINDPQELKALTSFFA